MGLSIPVFDVITQEAKLEGPPFPRPPPQALRASFSPPTLEALTPRLAFFSKCLPLPHFLLLPNLLPQTRPFRPLRVSSLLVGSLPASQDPPLYHSGSCSPRSRPCGERLSPGWASEPASQPADFPEEETRDRTGGDEPPEQARNER